MNTTRWYGSDTLKETSRSGCEQWCAYAWVLQGVIHENCFLMRTVKRQKKEQVKFCISEVAIAVLGNRTKPTSSIWFNDAILHYLSIMTTTFTFEEWEKWSFKLQPMKCKVTTKLSTVLLRQIIHWRDNRLGKIDTLVW